MAPELVRHDAPPKPSTLKINGLTPQELGLVCHEMRKPLTIAQGFFKMADDPLGRIRR